MDATRAQSWQITRTAKGAIYSRFIGPTPTAEMLAFIAALNEAMPQANARLIFDLSELNGYNSETKAPIKAWLLEHKLAIQELTVIVPKARTIVKMVVAAISLATGVKMQIREAGEEVSSYAAS